MYINLHEPGFAVESQLDEIRERLESIKYTVEAAILLIDDSKKSRSHRWTNCGEIIHLAEPVSCASHP